MIRICLLFFSLTFLSFVEALAQNKVPRFKDYPAGEPFVGKNAPLVLTKEDRMFRTRLREAAHQRPNFAGHFIVTTFGCGSECVMGAVIDAKTGKVYGLPHTICCWGAKVDDKFEPVEFRLESKLIVFSGARNEKEGDEGTHFYKFENGRFILIRSVRKTK